MNEPVWLSYLRTNSDAMSSFLEYLESQNVTLLQDMRRAVSEGKANKALEIEGQIKLLDTLRNQCTLQNREARAYEEYKERLT